MGIVRKFTSTARWIENVAAEEAPRPDPPAEQPAEPDAERPDDNR